MRASDAKLKVCPSLSFFLKKKCIATECMEWVSKKEYTDIKKIEAHSNEERDEKLKNVNLSDKHVLISNKSRMFGAMLTYGIPILEETGCCRRVNNAE